MRARVVLPVLYLLMLALWVVSFFLPALYLSGPVNPGWKAAAISAVLLGTLARNELGIHLYYGSFFLANLLVLASPWAYGRARRGRGGVFLGLMVFWDLLTFSYAVYDRWKNTAFTSVRLGYWMWEASLVGVTVVLLAARLSSGENRDRSKRAAAL